MSIVSEIMPTFSGDATQPVKRIITGLHSFDRALGNAAGEIGMPIGAGYELMGRQGAGKTTFGYSMLGFLGNLLETDVALISFEDYDIGALQNVLQAQEFSGDTLIKSQGEDEEMLEAWLDAIRPVGKKKVAPRRIAMLDSIAAISPASERNGEFGMGFNTGRAIVMSQLSKRILPVMAGRNPGSDYVIFYTNHYYQQPGGTWGSPGGNVKEYLCRVRIRLKKAMGGSYNDGYVLEGHINKNNYGYEKTKFNVFIRYGYGVHWGLTAMIDAIVAKKAKKEKNTTVISIGDESFGRINDIITNKYQDAEFFKSFVDVLKEDEND